MFNNQTPFKANGTIAPSVFVKIDTSGDHLVIQATAGSRTIGISQQGMKRAPGLTGSDTTIAAQAGDALMVFTWGDDAPITCGGTVTAGDLLKSDANGKGVTSSADGDWVAAEALESGTSGAIIRCLIRGYYRGN